MKLVRLGLSVSSILWMSAASAGQSLMPDWTAEGNQAVARFGAAASSAGDVNRDGYDDVIVAADVYDHGQTDEGRAFLFLGSRDGLAKLPAWTAEVDQPGARLSAATGAGDVNGDGFGDALVGAYFYSNGEYLEGIALLYHGSPAGLEASPAWSAEGNEQVAYFGSVVAAAGDVNGDGYGDVLVGAIFADIQHAPQAEGAAFLYLGSPGGLSTSPAWSAQGNQAFSGFGNARSAGDVNGDGYGDVVVGASAFNNPQRDEGRVFLYLGSAAGLAANAAWTAEGDQPNAWFGSSVAGGDVDGDGYDDLAVGRPSQMGRILVYRGSPGGLSATPAWIVEGDLWSSQFGHRVDTGDLNGDGYADVIVSAPAYSHGQQGEGRVFAFFGSPLGMEILRPWVVEGNQRNCEFGFSLARAGDVNGDGLDDVIVGADQFDAGQQDEGRAFVYLGSSRRRLR